MEIYTFDKSLVERLQEFTDILSCRDAVPASLVYSEWCSYTELVLERAGWTALWRIPRDTCELFKVRYPNVVLVTVKDIQFEFLTATVDIEAVNEDIILPAKYEVDLKHLYVTKTQMNESLDAEETANCIDKLRFFYQHVWMPWDNDNDKSEDWVSRHLETRLRLHYAVCLKLVGGPTAQHIRALLSEAKNIQAAQDKLQQQFNESQISINMDYEIIKNPEESDAQMIDFYLRLKQIKDEVELLENPEMRTIIDQKHTKMFEQSVLKGNTNPETYIILNKTTVDDNMDILSRVKKFIPDKNSSVNFYPSMMFVMELLSYGDTVNLGKGFHEMEANSRFEDDCIIRGLYDPSETILATSAEDSNLLITYGKVTLENLTLHAKTVNYAINLRNRIVTLRNCTIIGDNNSSTKIGVMVNSACTLLAEKCSFRNFGTGIFSESGSTIILKNCEITNCGLGIQVIGDTVVVLDHSVIKDGDIGLCLEFEGRGKASGDINILEGINQISLKHAEITNNKRTNVKIRQTFNINVAELLNCTVIEPPHLRSEQSDEHMESGSST